MVVLFYVYVSFTPELFLYLRSFLYESVDTHEKEIKMKCLWHEPFKKWIPVHPV